MTATPIWHDLRTLTIEGQGWTDTLSPYDRLPARAAGKVPDPVWHLSQDSAGLCARFQTDAPALRARAKRCRDTSPQRGAHMIPRGRRRGRWGR